MAENLKTRIVLRNDTTAKWEAVKSTAKLLKGEIGIEFDPSADVAHRVRMKVGDGIHFWEELPYFGETSSTGIYQADIDYGADKLAAIATAVGSATLNKGDIAIVRETIVADPSKKEYTAFVYDGSAWVAMDGNYNAENVYFREDITLAGDYTQVGNLTKDKTGTATLNVAGKNVKEAFMEIFTKRLQPTKTNPTANFKTYSGISDQTVEPGTEVSGTVSYEIQLNSAGSYTYGPATGVTESGTYSITYDDGTTAGQTKDTKTGTFDYSFTVGTSNKQVKVTASSVGYTAGAVAKDNLGSDSNPEVKIAASTASAGTKTNTITSSRKSFWSVDNTTGTVLHPATTDADEKAADSALVRALASKEFGVKKSYTLTIAAGTNRVIIAVPGTHSMTSCIDVDGMGLDVKDNFTTYTNNIYVGGADATDTAIGAYATTYTVFVVENAAGLAATTYKITLS